MGPILKVGEMEVRGNSCTLTEITITSSFKLSVCMKISNLSNRSSDLCQVISAPSELLCRRAVDSKGGMCL